MSALAQLETALATAGAPYYALTSKADSQRRIDAILDRVRRGESN